MAPGIHALFRVAIIALVSMVLLDMAQSRHLKKSGNGRIGDSCRECNCDCAFEQATGRGFWRWWFFRQRAKCKLCSGSRKRLCCPSTITTIVTPRITTATRPSASSMTSILYGDTSTLSDTFNTSRTTSLTTPETTQNTEQTTQPSPTTSATQPSGTTQATEPATTPVGTTQASTTSKPETTTAAPTTLPPATTTAAPTTQPPATTKQTTTPQPGTTAPTTAPTAPAVSCDSAYGALNPTHTLCMTTNGNFTGTCSVDIQVILDTHNGYRSGVTPQAINMQKMVWDADLAAIAQAWSEQCQIAHDTNTRYLIGVSPSPGQNGAFGYGSWTAAIAGWYNEVTDFQYGIPLADYSMTFGQIGHYTQVVQDKASRIGCGCAQCKDVLAAGRTYPHYFCNYFGPNMKIIDPYEDGSQCASCPDTCVAGLCDCSGKYCYNYGTLDVNTCTCSCRSTFTGPECLTPV